MLDPTLIADRAELRYVSDEEPGVARRRRGKGFSYTDRGGHSVTTGTRSRIKSLAIPPAWTEVWICASSNGHIQATGRDAAGRKQYRYHPEWERVRDEVKFDRMAPLGHRLFQLRKRVEADLHQRGLPRTKVLALGVAVLDQTLIRVGNGRYARQNGSFGLTTITNEHAEITGKEVQLSFIAKGGAQSDIALEDGRLAGLVAQCQELGGQSLFTYRDPEGEVASVRSEDINNYLRTATGLEVTAKDLRTWGASALFTARLGAGGDAVEAGSELLEAVDFVAEALGNTRAVCRASYLHPDVADTFLTGNLAKTWRVSRSGSWMSRGESALLKILDQ